MKFDFDLSGIKDTFDVRPIERYIRSLPKLIKVFSASLLSPEVSPMLKAYAIFGISYFFSPMDIIPDFFTGIGFVDDTILALLIMQAFLNRIDKNLLEKLLKKCGATHEEVFFDVREGTEKLAKFVGSIYKVAKYTFEEVSKAYAGNEHGEKEAEEVMNTDEGGGGNPRTAKKGD